MTLKEYCDSCQNKGSHKCHSCMGKYYDGVLQGKPTKYREKPQTNADRIRAMSDEELAAFLESTHSNMAIKLGGEYIVRAKEYIEIWLKQPAEVDNG